MGKEMRESEQLEKILKELDEIKVMLKKHLILRPRLKGIIANKYATKRQRENSQKMLDTLDASS